MLDKQGVYDCLRDHHIDFEITDHAPLFSMDDKPNVQLPYPDWDAKNLFIRDHKREHYYLITVRGSKRVDLKQFRKDHKLKKISFGSEEELWDILFEKKDALSIVNDGKAVVTLTEFTVDSNEIDMVQRQYQLDMERAVRDDAGYKAGYVLRERNAKNRWYVIQIYSDQEALTKHLNSPGYRFMMSQIQGSLQGVTTKVLDGDILVNHGGQAFVRP